MRWYLSRSQVFITAIKKVKISKKKDMVPLFWDWVDFVVIVRKGCGWFGEVKTEIFDHERWLRWWVVKSEVLGDFWLSAQKVISLITIVNKGVWWEIIRVFIFLVKVIRLFIFRLSNFSEIKVFDSEITFYWSWPKIKKRNRQKIAHKLLISWVLFQYVGGHFLRPSDF